MSRSASQSLPRWRKAEPVDRLRNHMAAEAMLEREVDGVLQVIERVRVRELVTCAFGRPFYRMLEIQDGEITVVHSGTDLLKEARYKFDRRAEKALCRTRVA